MTSVIELPDMIGNARALLPNQFELRLHKQVKVKNVGAETPPVESCRSNIISQMYYVPDDFLHMKHGSKEKTKAVGSLEGAWKPNQAEPLIRSRTTD